MSARFAPLLAWIFGPISFRRMLLSRMLLLSVPVLLIGQFVTYRQVRLSLLAATHDNLLQNAQRQGDELSQFVMTLRLSASVAREALPVMTEDLTGSALFLKRLSRQLPMGVECVWLESIASGNVLANTCQTRTMGVPPYPLLVTGSNTGADTGSNTDFVTTDPRDAITVQTFFSAIDSAHNTQLSVNIETQTQLPRNMTEEADQAKLTTITLPTSSRLERRTYFVVNAPVLSQTEAAPEYVLRLTARLPVVDYDRPDRPQDTTLITDANNVILSYPLKGYVGYRLNELPNYERLVELTQESSTEFAQRAVLSSNIFGLDNRTHQAIVGHVQITDPTVELSLSSPGSPWIVMTVTDLDVALDKLTGVRGVMFNLVLLLLAANLIATLFLTRDLARPLERLGRYARSIECNMTPEALPARFSIHEFNQLAKAMKASIGRLKAWANELSEAWQNARQANQLKNEFLTTISHELRTPLNGIIGSLRLVHEGFCEDRDEELDFLQRADDLALHLLTIINDILDISKIESGTVTIAPKVMDIRQLMQEAIELQQHEINTKALELSLNLGDSSMLVYVDPEKLRRVLVNVVGNAVKFTEAGQITITIQTRPGRLHPSTSSSIKPDKNNIKPNINPNTNGKAGPLCVAIEISDTGIGIDPCVHEKLFEPFVMVDGSTTRKFGGTGLGLAISRNLLEMMGGSIAIDSLGVDRGTTVTIELPLAHAISSDHTKSGLYRPDKP